MDYSASGMAGGINASLVLNAQGVQRTFKMTGGTQVNMGVSGRYIRIYHSDAVAAGSLLSLTGLKVYAGGVDVAAGRPSAAGADKNALNSIALYNNQAALTDGVLGGAWNGGNTAATSNLAWAGGSKAYIELDLGGQYMIDSLGLWGRSDAPSESGNLRVYVSSTAFTSSATAYADLAANTAVKRFDVAMIDTAVSTVFTDTLSGIENLAGTAQADVLTGDAGNNSLNGLAGNDALSGDAGNDTLAGGTGADALNGGAGDDRYLFNLGDGQDTVVDATARNWYVDASRHIEQLQFADGTVWTVDSLRAMDISATGTAGADTITGWDGRDVIDGGAGNDMLNGLAGNDRYLAYRGMGQDCVVDNDAATGNTDVLSFGPDIATDQLWFGHTGNDLQVGIIGTADKITVQNWYLGNDYHVEQIKTSDNKVLLDTQVEALVQAMASFAPPAMGQTSLTASQQTALAPVLAANWH